MLTYMKLLYQTFLKDDEGASAIEYGLIIGLIAVILIAVLAALGGGLDDLFQDASDAVANPESAGGTT